MSVTDAVAQILQNEWSFGAVGIWYVAYSICSRVSVGMADSPFDALQAYTTHHMENPRPTTRTAYGAAQAVVAVCGGANPHVMLSTLASFKVPDVFVPAPWWDDWPPLPWCLSKQDAKEHNLPLADVVVSWFEGQEIVTQMGYNVTHELHLYMLDPWNERERIIADTEEAVARGMRLE